MSVKKAKGKLASVLFQFVWKLDTWFLGFWAKHAEYTQFFLLVEYTASCWLMSLDALCLKYVSFSLYLKTVHFCGLIYLLSDKYYLKSTCSFISFSFS